MILHTALDHTDVYSISENIDFCDDESFEGTAALVMPFLCLPNGIQDLDNFFSAWQFLSKICRKMNISLCTPHRIGPLASTNVSALIQLRRRIYDLLHSVSMGILLNRIKHAWQ